LKIALLAAAIFAADRTSKNLVEKKLSAYDKVEVIKNAVYITKLRNRGAPYGLLSDRPKTLAALTAVSVALFSLEAAKRAKEYGSSGAFKFSIACIIGGGAGNIYSRIKKGYVTDFLQIKSSPAFNVADISILAGMCAFMGDILIRRKITKSACLVTSHY
jgi:signal peptidase II